MRRRLLPASVVDLEDFQRFLLGERQGGGDHAGVHGAVEAPFGQFKSCARGGCGNPCSPSRGGCSPAPSGLASAVA